MSLISLLWDRDDSACRLQQSEFGGADCNSLSLEGLPRQDAVFCILKNVGVSSYDVRWQDARGR